MTVSLTIQGLTLVICCMPLLIISINFMRLKKFQKNEYFEVTSMLQVFCFVFDL